MDARRLRARQIAGRLRPLRIYERVEAATSLVIAGTPTLQSPHRLMAAVPAVVRWRGNPAAMVTVPAARHPWRTAIVDDEGALSFAELDRRTSALAASWAETGLGPGTTIGILCRNGRVLVESAIAAHKLGADVVHLNTGFSAPQVADVVVREGVDVLVYDDALANAAAKAAPQVAVTEAAIRAAVAGNGAAPRLRPPASAGRMVILTSGTTGRPKGALRSTAGANPLDAAGILSCLPVLSGDTTVVLAPMFHGLGLFMANLALGLSSTVVLRSRFDPEAALEDIAANGAAVVIAVPAMLQRILALPRRVLDAYELPTLRIVISGGSALSGDLAHRFMDRFGDVLYNVYGSTETTLATVATPRDLRAAPGTAGRSIPGVTVRIAGDDGRPVAPGVTGRILIGSSLRSQGYTGGGHKEVVDGLVATGDVGHKDRWGRLFIDGREDEMIVSGGENVYPAEVEDLLARHPDVAEAAAIGVADEEYGQRLKAFVVPRPGASPDANVLKAYVHDQLARFKVPRDIVFLDDLPRTATGKVLKRRLS